MMKVGRSGMLNSTPSPCFVMEKKNLDANLEVFTTLKEKTDITWLYTLKCFHEPDGLHYIANTLSGFSIGNLNEFSKAKTSSYEHIHSYAPAFYESEVMALADASNTMSFNSLTQWIKYNDSCAPYSSLGMRLNPKLTLEQPAHCDASSANSRFGMDYQIFIEVYEENESTFEHLEGLHFHTFCHQELSALKSLLEHISNSYTAILPKLKWLNFGGGLNFTNPTFDLDGFVETINTFQDTYPHLQLYFEPGSTIVHETGYFTTTVLDIIEDSPAKVILDTSIESHLLDIAITKQTLNVRGTSDTQTPYMYELTGVSCIAGDILGTYYFDAPLQVEDNVIFENMMGYTLVKQTKFNGIKKAEFNFQK